MDLATLKAVFEPLSELGKDERSFDVEGHTVTLRPLLPHEEVAVQRYAVSILEEPAENDGTKPEDQAMDRAQALDYFDRFRIEVIAHTLIQIDDHDFRDITTIETGETTEEGVAVKVSKAKAIRGIIRNNWSRTMITAVFAQYGELVEKLARDADKIAGRSAADLDVEIERVQERLEGLREERKRRAKGDPGIGADQIQELVGLGDRELQRHKHAAQTSEKKKQAGEAVRADHETKMEEINEKLAESAAQREERKSVVTGEPVANEGEDPLSHVASSFEDPEDPGVLDAERRRIMEARRRTAKAERDRLASGTSDALSDAEPAGQVGGVDAYRLPATELSPRGRKHDVKGEPLELDPKADGDRNPNFRRR